MQNNNFKKIEIIFAGIVIGYLTFYWIMNVLYFLEVIDYNLFSKLFHRGEGYSEYTSFLLFPIVVFGNSVFFKEKKEVRTLYFFAYLVGVIIGILAVIL